MKTNESHDLKREKIKKIMFALAQSKESFTIRLRCRSLLEGVNVSCRFKCQKVPETFVHMHYFYILQASFQFGNNVLPSKKNPARINSRVYNQHDDLLISSNDTQCCIPFSVSCTYSL
jgi:hypothetical protein